MTALAHNDFIQDAVQCWKKMSPVVHEPQNADDYEKLSGFLDKLLDIVGENESHDLMGLVDVVSHMLSILRAGTILSFGAQRSVSLTRSEF